MRQVLKETQERVRMFDEAQRRWQQERLQSSPLSQQSSVSGYVQNTRDEQCGMKGCCRGRGGGGGGGIQGLF